MDTITSQKMILSRHELKALGINVSNTTLLRWEHLGRFPRRIRPGGTRVGWIAAEVVAWLEDRCLERKTYKYGDPY